MRILLEIAAWARCKEQKPQTVSVIGGTNVASSDLEAASLVFSHWQDLWKAQEEDNHQLQGRTVAGMSQKIAVRSGHTSAL